MCVQDDERQVILVLVTINLAGIDHQLTGVLLYQALSLELLHFYLFSTNRRYTPRSAYSRLLSHVRTPAKAAVIGVPRAHGELLHRWLSEYNNVVPEIQTQVALRRITLHIYVHVHTFFTFFECKNITLTVFSFVPWIRSHFISFPLSTLTIVDHFTDGSSRRTLHIVFVSVANVSTKCKHYQINIPRSRRDKQPIQKHMNRGSITLSVEIEGNNWCEDRITSMAWSTYRNEIRPGVSSA